MDNIQMPLSREVPAAAAAAGEVVKKAGHHHWGHPHWGRHLGHHCRCGMWAAGAFIAVPTFGGYLNSLYAAHKYKEENWIRSLKMPSWTLPEPMFGPIWNACYASMGLASFIVWRHGGGFTGKAQLPLMLYGGHLALNLSWIPIAYGAKSLKLASAISVGTMALATAATVTFHSVNTKAAYIMVPYLAWLLYETALTITMCKMNKEENQD